MDTFCGFSGDNLPVPKESASMSDTSHIEFHGLSGFYGSGFFDYSLIGRLLLRVMHEQTLLKKLC
jgi:hypothetical protein